MTSTTTSPPTLTGLLDELFLGRVRWDLLRPFPEQDAADRALGDAAVARMRELLRTRVNPAALDLDGELPADLLGLLREEGFLTMLIAPELGGLGLSPMNTLRVVQVTASWSPAISWMLSITNGLGSGNYLPLLAEGPLRELVLEKVRGRAVSGSADTETGGAANRSRETRAVLVEDGAAYLLTGEKIYIGNGALAEIVDVTAAVEHEGVDQTRVFFVSTDTPGVESVGRHEFIGLHGSPIGVLRFNGVRVPAEQLLPASADEWRDEPELVRLAVLGRMLIIASPSLAIAKLCLTWSREFVNRRTMDGRPLGDYEEIQRLVAQTAADVFAIESVVQWGMLSGDLAELTPELTAAKNLTSMTCWQVIDRTISLMGGEGIETARSKALRGSTPLPVERFARDARGLRVAGGVDFLLDYWTALAALDGLAGLDGPAGLDGGESGQGREQPELRQPPTDRFLSPRCQKHLARVQSEATALAAHCRGLLDQHGLEELTEREHQVMLVGQVASTLLGMALTLARAAHLAEQGNSAALELADISCTEAGHQLSGLWARLAEEPAADYPAISERVLHTDQLDFLLDGVITDLPPYAADGKEGRDAD
ncbi:acyl-CoA/acyl-ACP dehydrogenase [Streptacidiphilus sp. 4-A2]|nr:acyl-CoA/acyl-ACP dehydrogenase [Streptacidiphilus sp. 4-A2]